MQQNYMAFERFNLWWAKRSRRGYRFISISNDNHAYPTALIQPITEIYEQIGKTLSDVEGFDFEVGLTEDESVFARADSLSDWANQFLLGLVLFRQNWIRKKAKWRSGR